MAENDQRTETEVEDSEASELSEDHSDRVDTDAGEESDAPDADDSSPEIYVPDYAKEPDEPESEGGEGMDSLFLSPDDSESELVEVVSEVVEDEEDRSKIIAELEERLEALEKERDDFKNRMMRGAADLENFRKRASREKEELRKFGIDRVVLELLPVIDNLERALLHATESENEGGVVDGVRMVYKQFVSALEKHGVKGFESKGDMFDPQKHEAIQQVETAEYETNTVLDEYQKGYWLHERLIRPALVSVAKKIEVADNEDTAEEVSADADDSTSSDEADGIEDSPSDAVSDDASEVSSVEESEEIGDAGGEESTGTS